eukprot:508053_1
MGNCNAFNRQKTKKCVMVGLNDTGKTMILYQLALGDAILLQSTTSFNHELIEYKNIIFDIHDIGWIFYKYNLKEPKNFKRLNPDWIGCYQDKNRKNIPCSFDGQDSKSLPAPVWITDGLTLNFTKSIEQIYNKYDTRKVFDKTDAIIFVISSDDPYSFTNDEKYKTNIKSNFDTDPLFDPIFVKQYVANIMREYKMNIPSGIADIIGIYYTRKFETSVKDLIETFRDMDQFTDCPILLWFNKQDLTNALSINQICNELQISNLLRNREWHTQACCALTGDGLYEGIDWIHEILKGKK